MLVWQCYCAASNVISHIVQPMDANVYVNVFSYRNSELHFVINALPNVTLICIDISWCLWNVHTFHYQHGEISHLQLFFRTCSLHAFTYNGALYRVALCVWKSLACQCTVFCISGTAPQTVISYCCACLFCVISVSVLSVFWMTDLFVHIYFILYPSCSLFLSIYT